MDPDFRRSLRRRFYGAHIRPRNRHYIDPLINNCLRSQNFHKTVLLATLWIVFFILNPFKVVAFWQIGVLTTPTLVTGLIGHPALWFGLRVGAWTHDKLPGRAFNLIVLSIALAGSLKLVLGSF